jgi:glucose dehydrogenase
MFPVNNFPLLSTAPPPAGGIVVFDLRTRVIKWQQHLDLTTATTKFTAHMFSSPTLADIDADGHMEVVVGTSVGFVYVLDSRVSATRTP